MVPEVSAADRPAQYSLGLIAETQSSLVSVRARSHRPPASRPGQQPRGWPASYVAPPLPGPGSRGSHRLSPSPFVTNCGRTLRPRAAWELPSSQLETWGRPTLAYHSGRSHRKCLPRPCVEAVRATGHSRKSSGCAVWFP
jgi:hypothetical protein